MAIDGKYRKYSSMQLEYARLRKTDEDHSQLDDSFLIFLVTLLRKICLHLLAFILDCIV